MKYRDFTEDEIKWIKSLQRVMKKAPDTLFMFCGGSNGSVYIMTKDEENERYIRSSGGMDNEAPCEIIDCGCEVDGGDW